MPPVRTDVTLSIADIVGSPICVSSEDAGRVHHQIVESVEAGGRVVLSFRGIERITIAFLNAAVGPLYARYGDTVREFMAPPADAEDWHLHRLTATVGRAKQTFLDQSSKTTDPTIERSAT